LIARSRLLIDLAQQLNINHKTSLEKVTQLHVNKCDHRHDTKTTEKEINHY